MHRLQNKAIALCAVLLVGAISCGLALERTAHAQSKPSNAGYGSGLPRKCDSSATSISAGTPAVLVSAVAGKSIIVKAMKLSTVTTGGLVSFYNGADASKFVHNTYVPVSSPTTGAPIDVPESIIGPGFKTDPGVALCAQLNGCTLVWEIQYQLE